MCFCNVMSRFFLTRLWKSFSFIIYPLISCLRFTVTKKGGNIDSGIKLDSGCLRDVFLILHIPVESAKGCTRFCKSDVHLVIHDDRLREGTAEVGELFITFSCFPLMVMLVSTYVAPSISFLTFLYRHLQLSQTLENSVCY